MGAFGQLFTRLRHGGRRPPDPLGDGVWRRAHDRCRRAVDRYHQVIEPVPPGDARNALERVAVDLVEVLHAVHAQCLTAQREAPSASLDVPGGPRGEHPALYRRLSRTAACVSQAAEAATMSRVCALAGDEAGALSRARAAARAARQAAGLARDGGAAGAS